MFANVWIRGGSPFEYNDRGILGLNCSIFNKLKPFSKHSCKVAVFTPLHLQEVIAQLQRVTKDKKGVTLNIVLSYTAREKIAWAVRALMSRVGRWALGKGELQAGDISQENIDENGG